MSTSRARRSSSPASVLLLGPSAIARQLRDGLALARRPRARTLIVAPPGMDVSAVARAIHGTEPSAPLMEIDCSADDPAAVERRLLGRASQASSGALEHVEPSAALIAARHGTCVLHGVEELSHRAQARLARALRDGEVHVRTEGAVPLRCRIVAIASATAATEEEQRSLRSDLRRRLGAVRLEFPPLAARREDIEAIAAALMKGSAARLGVSPRPFTDAALALVSALQWPDNVTGLTAMVESLVGHGPEPVRVEEVLSHLGSPAQAAIVPHASLREARRQFERDYITAVLRRYDGRVAAAARALGIQRTNLYRKARQLGIHNGGRAS